MPKVIILGSSNAIPSQEHENTHMVVVGEERMVLIDCVSNPDPAAGEGGAGLQ